MKGAEFCQITPFLCLLKLRGLSPLLSGVCMMHTYVYNVCDNECDNECEHHCADCTEVGESLRCQFLPSFYLV